MTHIVTNIILKGDRVLVGRYSERNPKEYLRGLYTGPGGGVELGETQWDAAAREIREETGTDAGLTPYGMRLFEALPAGHGFTMPAIVAAVLWTADGSYKPRTTELDKVGEWRWVPIEQHPGLLCCAPLHWLSLVAWGVR